MEGGRGDHSLFVILFLFKDDDWGLALAGSCVWRVGSRREGNSRRYSISSQLNKQQQAATTWLCRGAEEAAAPAPATGLELGAPLLLCGGCRNRMPMICHASERETNISACRRPLTTWWWQRRGVVACTVAAVLRRSSRGSSLRYRHLASSPPQLPSGSVHHSVTL